MMFLQLQYSVSFVQALDKVYYVGVLNDYQILLPSFCRLLLKNTSTLITAADNTCQEHIVHTEIMKHFSYFLLYSNTYVRSSHCVQVEFTHTDTAVDISFNTSKGDSDRFIDHCHNCNSLMRLL